MKMLLLCLVLSSCSIKQFYPTGGALVGGSVGALTGNPIIAGLSAGSGAMLGEMAKGNAELKEAQEELTALTHGDVSVLLEKGMAKHQSGFDTFKSTIKNILIIAGVLLGLYLLIPIFIAKKCSKTEAIKNATRPPFPIK